MQEFLDFLKKFVGDKKQISTEDAAQVASYIRSNGELQPLYQHVYDIGHADATGRHKSRERDLERERDAEKARADKASTDLEDFKKTAPNVQEVETRFKADMEKLDAKNKELEKTHREERERWHRESASKDLSRALIGLGVDPEWAEYLASKEENQKRIKVTTANGSVVTEILREGSEMTLQADKPIEAFAAELRKGVKAAYITSSIKDTGSNERGGGDSGGSGIFDTIRKDQEQRNAQARPEGFKSAAERLGAGV